MDIGIACVLHAWRAPDTPPTSTISRVSYPARTATTSAWLITAGSGGADHGQALLVRGGGQQGRDGAGVRWSAVRSDRPRSAAHALSREPGPAPALGSPAESRSTRCRRGERGRPGSARWPRVGSGVPSRRVSAGRARRSPRRSGTRRRGLLREVADPLSAQARELLTVTVTERLPVERDLARTGRSSPASSFSSVVLPAPERPVIGQQARDEVVREPAQHVAPRQPAPVGAHHGAKPDPDGARLLAVQDQASATADPVAPVGLPDRTVSAQHNDHPVRVGHTQHGARCRPGWADRREATASRRRSRALPGRRAGRRRSARP